MYVYSFDMCMSGGGDRTVLATGIRGIQTCH